MTKKTIAILLSIFVAVMPFLGFPEQFDKYFYLIAGLLIAALIELISIQHRYENNKSVKEVEGDIDHYDSSEEVV